MYRYVVSGVPYELYYVRDSVISRNALKYNIRVPSQVSELPITWQTDYKQPVSALY